MATITNKGNWQESIFLIAKFIEKLQNR